VTAEVGVRVELRPRLRLVQDRSAAGPSDPARTSLPRRRRISESPHRATAENAEASEPTAVVAAEGATAMSVSGRRRAAVPVTAAGSPASTRDVRPDDLALPDGAVAPDVTMREAWSVRPRVGENRRRIGVPGAG